MLLKNWNPELGRYEVVFDLPPGLDVDRAAVVGDFNDWSDDSHVMERTDDGRFEVRVLFDPGARSQFRYRIDDDRWENDWNADDYVANEFGGEDSLLIVPEAPPSVEPSGGPAPKKAAGKKAASKKAAAKKSPIKKKAAGTKKAPVPKKAAGKTAAAEKSPTEKRTGEQASGPE